MGGGMPELPRFLRVIAASGGLGMAWEMYEDMSTGARQEATNIRQGAEDANAKAIADAKATQAAASSQAMAQIEARKRAMARSKTVYTSPLGLTTEASTARKQLLGQ
jgi:Rod binding domain-containing protein